MSNSGVPLGNVFRISVATTPEAFYPAVACNATDNEFLVTFDTVRSIHAGLYSPAAAEPSAGRGT